MDIDGGGFVDSSETQANYLGELWTERKSNRASPPEVRPVESVIGRAALLADVCE
jgi:hypothetical protein